MAYIIKELQNTIPQRGRILLITRRAERRGTVESLPQISISIENGLEGDHYSGKNKKRQVTLIQAEHLDAVSNLLGKEIDPTLTRRNLLVSGINLLAFSDHKFQIGDSVILEMTGHCHPCSRMEENLGPGGYQAMRGHGGITARVIRGGIISQGDSISLLPNHD
ncbi:MAG: MOSC domain-containing protein [Saprospiraceae bacterium]|nr:MOSC domain-containing protein [Saprospiraceae bacterium]